jgi:hypothetical protein
MRQLNCLVLWAWLQKDRLRDVRRGFSQDFPGLGDSLLRCIGKQRKLALRLLIAFVALWAIVQLIAGRIDPGEFLAEIAVDLIANLLLKWASDQ